MTVLVKIKCNHAFSPLLFCNYSTVLDRFVRELMCAISKERTSNRYIVRPVLWTLWDFVVNENPSASEKTPCLHLKWNWPGLGSVHRAAIVTLLPSRPQGDLIQNWAMLLWLTLFSVEGSGKTHFNLTWFCLHLPIGAVHLPQPDVRKAYTGAVG